ncbi:recombinase family protein [Desulfogranum japonicum]|uniref:recombinase family protein n=1 Tax=Desulfogranum japonicum TaxID=231447 RepID=UPI0003FC7B6B|nr:recombinase family protein [Desulfogranum japonicum]
MSNTIAYLRLSTDSQDLKNQKLEILEYADKHGLRINEWLEVKMSSRRSRKERLIDLLLEKLNSEDCLIVAELSRLGRSAGQSHG